MLFNGEQIGDGSPPSMDIAVDPVDGTTLTVARPRRRDRGDRDERAGHDVRPRSVRLHGEDRGRSRGRRRHRHQRAGEGEPRGGREGARREGQRRHRGHPRPRPPRRHHPRVPRGRRAHPADPRRRRRRRDLGRVAQLRQRHPVRRRRHARRRDRRVRAEGARRLDPGQALAAQRRGAHAPRSTRATTSTRC